MATACDAAATRRREDASQAAVKCPDGHLLQNSHGYPHRTAGVCDVCEAYSREAQWTCSRCDYDLCRDCYRLLQPTAHGQKEADRFFAEGNWTSALAQYKRQLARVESVLGSKKHRICAGTRKAVARTLFRLGETDAAVSEANRALALEKEVLGPDDFVPRRTGKLVRSMHHLRKQPTEPSGEACPRGESSSCGDAGSEQDPTVLGVSCDYLRTTFMAELRLGGNDETSPVHQIENLQNAVEMGVIRRKGASVESTVDGKLGEAYVNCLRGEDNVGPANYMLSYSWSYAIGDIVDTLMEYCQSNGLDPKRTYIWIDCLCINQHRVVQQKEGGGTGLLNFEQEFPGTLKKIGHMLAMMAPWNEPIYLTRVWCIFELYTAQVNDCTVSMILPLIERAKLAQDLLGQEGARMVLRRAASKQEEVVNNVYESLVRENLLHRRGGGGIGKLYEALANTKVQNAKASLEADRRSILRLIESGPGYDGINNSINDMLRSRVREVIRDIVECQSNTHSTTYAALLARVGCLLGDNEETTAALELFQSALDIYQTLLGPDSLEAATCYSNIGNVYHSHRQYDEALTEYAKALSIRTQKLGSSSIGTASLWCKIGSVLFDQGDLDGALEKFRAANEVAIFTDHTLAANSFDGIGNALESQGELTGALEAYRMSLDIRVHKAGKHHVDTATSHHLVGNALLAAGDYENALEEFSKCLSIRTTILGADHPSTKACFHNISNLMDLLGNGKEEESDATYLEDRTANRVPFP